jgi:phosphoglycolate phosphatase-like HAD superfamily hydrolase
MPIARTLFTEDKKLRVFDFDDTLVKTNSFIYVTDKDGKKSKLSPGQYAVYKERPGDVFDYTDFQKVTEPKLIKGYVELLRRMVNSGGSREVFILTARSAEKPVSKFIKDLGIRGVTVVALGDANPEKKADWIEDKVKAGFDDVYFIDDSPKNVEAVRKRLKNYPNVKQKIQQVKPKEEMESQSTKLTSMLPKADLTKTIKNPDTGRDIKLKSALQYDKDSKVFKAAEKMIKK